MKKIYLVVVVVGGVLDLEALDAPVAANLEVQLVVQARCKVASSREIHCGRMDRGRGDERGGGEK